MNALGGKDYIGQITSVYTEGSLDVMGTQGIIKTTIVNGKGLKTEIDVGGTVVVMCYTDTAGWQINPMTGNYESEWMPADQYKANRDDIFIGGPFISDYTANGYKVELMGQESVGTVNAYRINVVSPANSEASYYFDPETWYLIKKVQKAEMMGQSMDIITTLSNYQKPENGYPMPYTLETNYGGQFFLLSNINKVELNQPVEMVVFEKP
jgi:hypothetical protein